MVSISNFVRRMAKTGVKYDSISTQVDLPGELAQRVLGWSQRISDIELYDTDEKKYGRENDAHITVLYGLKNTDPYQVTKVLKSFGPFEVRLGIITAFRDSKDYDVLKVDVESSILHKIHYLLEDQLENDNSYPTYAPHMTLAYLKKGNVDKYIGDQSFQGSSFLAREIKFCTKDSIKIPISLVSDVMGIRAVAKKLYDMHYKDVAKQAESFYQEFMHSKEGEEASKKALKNNPEYKEGKTAEATDEIMKVFHSWLGSKMNPGDTFGAIYSLVRTKVESGIS